MSEQRFVQVRDESSHRYYIPFDRLEHWWEWSEIDEDDPASWDVPDYARRIDGGYLTFTDPRIEKGP